MIKKIIIGCIIYLSLFSCQKKNSYLSRYTLKSGNDTINIKLGSNSTNLSVCIQYLTSNDTNYLAVLTKKRSSIEIYNLDTRKIYKVVNIRNEGANSFLNMYGFVMKNIDSILAVGVLPQQVGIINDKGEVLKRIHYEKDSYGRPVNPSFAALGCRPFVSGDSVFLIPAFRTDESMGILTSTKHENTSVNISINYITGESKESSLNLPTKLIGKDITGMRVCRVMGYSNCFVYNYSLIDGLFVTHDFLNLEEVPIETNYKFKLKENLWKYRTRGSNKATKYYLSRDEGFNIHYDSYRECYYLVILKRTDEFEKNTDYRLRISYPHCFIIILDKSFNYMGDVYFPDDIYSFRMMFIAPKGLYISTDHINNPTFSEDYMRFSLFTLEKID